MLNVAEAQAEAVHRRKARWHRVLRLPLQRKRAYDLMQAAEVVSEISDTGLPAPASEFVARKLAPLRDEPGVMREAWKETVTRHGDAPTGAQTREVVMEAAALDHESEPAERKFADSKRNRDVAAANKRRAWQIASSASGTGEAVKSIDFRFLLIGTEPHERGEMASVLAAAVKELRQFTEALKAAIGSLEA